MLPCPFHLLTGLNCPFCGGQRMMEALLHGELINAFWLNPALAVALPIIGVWWLWKREISSRTALVMLGVAVAWGITRIILSI